MDFFRARPGPAPGRGNDSNPAYMNNGRLFKVREIFAGLTHKSLSPLGSAGRISPRKVICHPTEGLITHSSFRKSVCPCGRFQWILRSPEHLSRDDMHVPRVGLATGNHSLNEFSCLPWIRISQSFDNPRDEVMAQPVDLKFPVLEKGVKTGIIFHI